MRKIGKTIHDYRGGALRLEATRLIEDYSDSLLDNWMASYASIRKAYRENNGCIRIEQTQGNTRRKTGFAIWSDFYRPDNFIYGPIPKGVGPVGVIGCRKFTTRTFNLILKAAGVVKPATKSSKKTLAARAGR